MFYTLTIRTFRTDFEIVSNAIISSLQKGVTIEFVFIPKIGNSIKLQTVVCLVFSIIPFEYNAL